MDELEKDRIGAQELALINTIASVQAERLIREDLRAMQEGLVVGITDEERAIRDQAIELLESALQQLGDQPVAARSDWLLAYHLAEILARRATV